MVSNHLVSTNTVHKPPTPPRPRANREFLSPRNHSRPDYADASASYRDLPFDIVRYLGMAPHTDGPILELCSGAGCIAIPLARAGYRVAFVNISGGMLGRLQTDLDRESREVGRRVHVLTDIAKLKLEDRDFPLAIIAANALLGIAECGGQDEVLRAVVRHLTPGGVVVIDLANPPPIHAGGEALSVFRFEIELMLESAGLELASIEGGHQREPYAAQSPKMFVVATKR